MHVDDFLWAGSVNFQKDVIAPLRFKFHIGKEMNNKFRYIGLDIEQDNGQNYLQQHDYTERLKQIDKTVESRDVKNDIYPEIVGQLHWIATQSRPDLCFDVLDLSTLFDLKESKLRSKMNKVARKAKYNQYKIVFPCLEHIEGMELLLFTDASYANLSDRFSSSEGYVIFLKGKNGTLVEGLDACYFVRSILHEMLDVKSGQYITIKCYTDNKSLCQNIHSTKLISGKPLRIDFTSIKKVSVLAIFQLHGYKLVTRFSIV